MLVALNTVDENTKFVKFSLNKTVQAQANAADWELLRDSARCDNWIRLNLLSDIFVTGAGWIR